MDAIKALWVYAADGSLVRNPALSDAEYAELVEASRQGHLTALWQAAHDYELEYISGSAASMVTLGLISGNEKCVAVTKWIQSIWSLYYQRKALVTHEWDAALYDFSECRRIPYSVPEIMAEMELK
jgi:hypothetical protein